MAESAVKHFSRRHDRRLHAFSHDDSVEVYRFCSTHPLAEAVHLAFSQHRPLRLTPDQIWLTIAQGFAHHVNNNAETLRQELVGFKGKMILQARTTSLVTAEDWRQVINSWVEDLGDFIPPELHRTLLCDFTTTTTAARVASQVVMMESFQRYFEYRLFCVCGIPSITLAGTTEDWKRIADRVKDLERYELQWWTDRLQPICRALVETADGNPPLEFWQHIYKPEELYGGDLITGWLADLFPYIRDASHTGNSSPTVRNPVLSVPRHQLRVANGIEPGLLPHGISRVPIHLETGLMQIDFELLAGFIGIRVSQHGDGPLTPEIGWGACEVERLSAIFDRVRQEHQTAAPLDPETAGDNVPFCPEGILRLLAEFDGATLYADTDHPWRVRPSADYEGWELQDLEMTRFIDLADGRSISYCDVERFRPGPGHQSGERLWLAVGKDEVKIIAKGLEQLFERILGNNGQYFFDETDFVPDDSV
jgi:hypothetical protein